MIEVGEYVRLARNQGINKIRDIEDGYYYFLDDEIADEYGNITDFIEKDELQEEVLNHSKNIIDLIEVGDYVNGYRILEKTKIKNNEMQICILKDNNCSNWRTVNDKTLKSIVTKEQFASMEYKVKE